MGEVLNSLLVDDMPTTAGNMVDDPKDENTADNAEY
jgi:hypothetical protein